MKLWFIVATGLAIAGCKKDTSPDDCGVRLHSGTEPAFLSILFIGTSHTYYNDLPALVSRLASALTIYSVIMTKRITGGFVPAALTKELTTTIQETVSSVLFDCNPGWRNF